MLEIKPLKSIIQTDTLKKGEKINKGKNGGYRPGSGRPKKEVKLETIAGIDIQKEIEKHGFDEVEIQVGGKIEKKMRILVLLSKLFELGMKGDAKAIKEYFDRQLGRAKQSIDMKGSLSIEDAMLKNIEKRRELSQQDEADDQ
jgi:hypothetical protein